MDTGTAARRYEARPGRAAVVTADLADLHGPASGRVTLPLRLFWSPAGRVWNLDSPEIAQAMYEHILGQAAREQELAEWLNRDMLIAFWPHLYLPKGIRRAWEERHPFLRVAAGRARHLLGGDADVSAAPDPAVTGIPDPEAGGWPAGRRGR